jgi:hypothetical protein
VDRACGTHEREEKCTRFWWEITNERDHSKGRGVNGYLGSKRIFRKINWEGVEWILLAQDRAGGGLL